MQNYNNSLTKVFHWRKGICQMRWSEFGGAGVVPNSDPCQIITPLVLVGLGLGVGEGLGLGVGLGLGNQIAISTRGVIIWQGVENGHNTGSGPGLFRLSPE